MFPKMATIISSSQPAIFFCHITLPLLHPEVKSNSLLLESELPSVANLLVIESSESHTT